MKAWGSVALGSMMVLVLACDSGVQDDSTAGSDAAAGLPTLRIDASAGGVCVPLTCAGLNATCGPQGDGCGNVIDCGACTAPDFCGGGGLSKCGAIASGTACTPKTCADLGAGCGKQGDGCGKVIDCGGCNAPAFCGGGGPSTCGAGTAQGDGGGCTPTKTSCATGDCGPIGNGCGELVPCGKCTAPELCGGGTAAQPGTPSKCGGAPPDGGAMCQPTTCQAAGANCGQIGDGCGGLTPDCGQCPSGQICGGGGMPSVCGPTTSVADAGACTGLCALQVKCGGNTTTTLTGTVFAPNGIEPLPSALVYVPNGGPAPDYGVQPFTQKVSCNRCGVEVTGNPLVKTLTAPDGTFTLSNVPVGQQIPLVIQLGRWRRMTTIAIASSCANNTAAATSTRLPRTQGEFGVSQNNIPLTAIATGGVDTLECVVRKIGVADSEFTSPTGTGRIHLWRGDNGPSGFGAQPPAPTGPTASWSGLYGDATMLAKYDQMIFACNGDPLQASMNNNDRGRVRDYLDAGGRLFATHYEYVWLNAFNPFSQTATWNVDQGHPNDPNAVTGDIDTSFPKGQVFAAWLGVVNALSRTTPPQIAINISRHDIDPLPAPPATGVTAPAQRWISVDGTRPNGRSFPNGYPNYVGAPQHYTFNTPWGATADNQCGRVLYSDFHVSNAQVDGATFPSECDNNALTPQEKVIEFMLFDLGNCITPDAPPPACTPKKCADLGIGCGPAGDGCGTVIQCGPCMNGQTCGGGVTPSQCGGPSCIPLTCATAGCGDTGDGCGGVLHCAPCTLDGGVNCTPRTCQQAGASCGQIGDGCGNLLDCMPCPVGQTCGGGGVPYQCGTPNCTPRTCQQANANCGPLADGCGGLLQCGTCMPPQTCGGGGVSSQCGGDIPPGVR